MTYLTIEGIVLDLTGLGPERQAYLERCLSAYKAGAPWAVFMSLVRGMENPLLRSTGGVITQAVYSHPLFLAVRDLEDRLGIQQGFLRWEKPLIDPVEDEWLSPATAAEQKAVSVQAIHQAIGRGELITRGDTRKQISRRSLDGWEPNRTRQRAGFARAEQQDPTEGKRTD